MIPLSVFGTGGSVLVFLRLPLRVWRRAKWSNGHLKTYNIVKEYVVEEYRSPIDRTLGQNSVSNYPEQIYTKSVRDVFSPYDHPSRGYEVSQRVVSFDFLNMSSSNEPSVLTLSADDQVKIITVKPPPPPVRLSSQGTLICGRFQGDLSAGD